MKLLALQMKKKKKKKRYDLLQVNLPGASDPLVARVVP